MLAGMRPGGMRNSGSHWVARRDMAVMIDRQIQDGISIIAQTQNGSDSSSLKD